jgi:GNAT superfamily N-acetyltransferase
VMVGFSREDLLAIERAAVRAWPATETRSIGGWLWRYSGGNSQRANSVSPLEYHGCDVDADIRAAEALYFARGAPSRFQVGAAIAAPADLDDRLQRLGYRINDPVTTLARRIGPAPLPTGVEIRDQPDEGWMEVYLSNITPDRRPPAPRILAAVPGPRAFLSFHSDGRVVSTALAVVTGTTVIAECVGTRAEVRRNGAARAVMVGVESWAAEQGATISALQAVTTNVPAQGLYAALGYVAVTGYHYRVRDP